VFVPSISGNTARMISRFKPRVWIVAIGEDSAASRGLQFSYGVEPVLLHSLPEDWREFANTWLREQKIDGNIALLVAAASPNQPAANHRLEFMRIGPVS
jgi:pyruvate kinase